MNRSAGARASLRHDVAAGGHGPESFVDDDGAGGEGDGAALADFGAGGVGEPESGGGVTDDGLVVEGEDAGVADRLHRSVECDGAELEAVGGEPERQRGRLRLQGAGQSHEAVAGRGPGAVEVRGCGQHQVEAGTGGDGGGVARPRPDLVHVECAAGDVDGADVVDGDAGVDLVGERGGAQGAGVDEPLGGCAASLGTMSPLADISKTPRFTISPPWVRAMVAPMRSSSALSMPATVDRPTTA